MKVTSMFAFTAIIAGSVATSIKEPSKPSIKCAYKWAESPDDVYVFVKWAHKLDAPAVNNVDSASLSVDVQPKHISIAAEHPTKHLTADIPLSKAVDVAASTWTLNAFGVNLVLRKARLQTAWGHLHGGGSSFKPPKNSHVWWDLKNQHEPEMNDLKNGGISLKWLESHPLKCEACRVAVENAVFSPGTLAGLKALTPVGGPKHLQPAEEVKFNASLAALAVAACAPESFAPTPRHPEASVKIQGRAVGGAAGGVAGPLKPEFRSACTGLTQGKAALARVVAALFVVHRALWNQDAPEIQRSTANGFPVDLLEFAATSAGRRLLANATAIVCQQGGASGGGAGDVPPLCPAANPSALSASPGAAPSSCGLCKLVVGDLEAKVLRYAHNHPDAANKGKGGASGGEEAARARAAAEVEAVCDEVIWRHGSTNGNKGDDADRGASSSAAIEALREGCEALVEEKEETLVAHLVAVGASGELSKAKALTAKSTGVCGKCKKDGGGGGKTKKEGTKKEGNEEAKKKKTKNAKKTPKKKAEAEL